MKIIFLDLDGVLNNWYHPELIDEKNALVLKKVLELSKAKIVLTSSNKYSFQREGISSVKGSFLEKYLEVLKTMNIPIYDITPYVLEDKSEEIKTYLKNNPLITDFVIIDDELVSMDLRKYQVYLDLYKGLEEEHIKPILDILSGKRGFYPENYNQLETDEQRLKRINRYYNQENRKWR